MSATIDPHPTTPEGIEALYLHLAGRGPGQGEFDPAWECDRCGHGGYGCECPPTPEEEPVVALGIHLCYATMRGDAENGPSDREIPTAWELDMMGRYPVDPALLDALVALDRADSSIGLD